MDKDNNTSLKPPEGEPPSAEGTEGARAPSLNRLVASKDDGGSRSETSPNSVPTGMPPNGGIPQNGPVPPMETMAALIQRHQEEQKLLQTRFLMQQQQQQQQQPGSDNSSLVAAAMATASSNLMSTGQYPPRQDAALLYQQALMEGRGGMLPPTGGAPSFAAGLRPSLAPPGVIPSNGMGSPGSRLAPSKRKKSRSTKERGPSYDDEDGFASSKHRPYFDGSTHPDPRSSEEEEEEDSDKEIAAKTKKNESFPKKLYRMIEDAKKNGQEDIISFFPHGRAFGIHKPAQFVSDIMPKYLTTTRMSSFQRQLNLYSFRRITEGRDKGGYFHEFFLQGRRGLVKKIKRKKPSVPKATKEDLDTAARLSNEMLASGNYVLPYGNTDTLQQMMMDRASAMTSPQDLGLGASFGYPPPPNPALLRGQAYPPVGQEGMPDQGGLAAYGAPPYGAQPPPGYIRSAPPM